MTPADPSGAHLLRTRAAPLGLAALLHAGVIAVLLMSPAHWRASRPGAGEAVGLVSLTLYNVPAGGGDGTAGRAAARPPEGRAKAAVPTAPGTGSDPAALQTDGGGALGEAIAQAVADDPFGGGAASYRDRLRWHISAHRQTPAGAARARGGVVVVRFNVDRMGRVIGARVVKTQGSRLDRAALATLWSAEPLPPVPADLPAPLEIEMPVDFRLRG